MAGGHYFFTITALPSMVDLGGAPPMSLAELGELVADDAGSAKTLIDVIALGDDLLQREAILAGEIEQASPTVLTAEQLRDEQPLPDYLTESQDVSPTQIPADALWGAYYSYAARTAARSNSRFLADWVNYEVTLRNAIAAARAKTLQLEPDDYMVTPELGEQIEDMNSLVNEWSAAADPLIALGVLDRARWQWLADNDRWFSFNQDELAAYAAKLTLLTRWDRLTTATEETLQAAASDAD